MEDSKLQEIKDRIDIVDLIRGYTQLTKAGRNFKGLCPFHSEKTPSFMVSPELQIFKCFGCGRGGDVFKFIQEADGVDFPAAVRLMAEKAGVQIEIRKRPSEKTRHDLILEMNHLASEFYNFILTKHKLGEPALNYLKTKRKITDKTISDFKIGYAPNSWGSLVEYLKKKGFRVEDVIASGLAVQSGGERGCYDRFRGRVVFPIKDLGGNVVGFSGRVLDNSEPKYLNTPETEAFHKGKILFAFDKAKTAIKREGLAVIVEGQMDVISAHQSGFPNVVASGGTALTLEQMSTIKKLAKDIAFCFDTDFAGVEAAKRGIEIAEEAGLNVRVVVIPKPYKDLDECVRENAQAFSEALQNAGSVYDFYFVTAFSRFNRYDPLGKKRIVEFLVPVLSLIRNEILKEHYVKKLASELGISEESVYKTVSDVSRGAKIEPVSSRLAVPKLSGDTLQEYTLSLILKSPLDIQQTNLYKLGQRDFTDPKLEKVFTELKSYLLGRKRKFEIKFFCAKLEDAKLAERVMQIYLKDYGVSFDEENEEALKRELTEVLRRVKTETVRRELKNLSIKIKSAEASQDTDEVARLSEEFRNISERLI